MSAPMIPTPQDQQLLLQDTTTRTSTFYSTPLDLGAGFAPGGLGLPAAAVVHISAIDITDGNEAYSIVLTDSPDNVDFAAVGPVVALNAPGTFACNGRILNRYVRLTVTMSGTTPSITFKAWLNPLP